MTTSAAPHPEPARVLVVDDNRAIHDDLRKVLCGRHRQATAIGAAAAELFGAEDLPAVGAAFAVDVADQGEQGLVLVQRALEEGRPYAMAFVDGRMPPGWDGVETISHLWRVSPDLQVVLCTAFSDYSWSDMIRRLGFSDRLVILKKPFENVEALQLATALSEKWRLLATSRAHVLNLETIVTRRTAELRASEERFRLIAQNAADLIGIVDADGSLHYHSPSCARTLGYSEAGLATRNFFELIDTADRPAITAAIRECIHRHTATTCEFRIQRRDGAWLTLESRHGPFRSAANVIEGALFVARDIGERRMIELQLRQAQKLESIGQLAAGVAHELNTPAQFIGDNVRFLREAFDGLREVIAAYRQCIASSDGGEVSSASVDAVLAVEQGCDAPFLLSEGPRAIAQTLEGVDRMTRILQAMKDFSHPGSQAKELVDLNHAVESTLTVSRNEWKYVADVVTNLTPDLPRVPALPGELKQVLLNLVVNAAHAIGDGLGENASGRRGTITINTRQIGRMVEVSVADTGTGISAEIRNRIFDPFFTTKPVGRGTGQGLAIARAVVVDRHGGTLTFDTVIGKGSVFIIQLPLDAAERAEREEETAA